MGRVKRLIRFFEGGVTSIRRATRKSLFKRSTNPKAASDRLHRTAQSAKAPLFCRRTAPASEPKPAKVLPKRRPVPAKAPAPVLAPKRLNVPRQPPKPRSPVALEQRPAWDFGDYKPRQALEVAAQIVVTASPDSLQLQADSRSDRPATAGAAVPAAASQHDVQSEQCTVPEPAAVQAATPQPAADDASALETAEDCPQLPWPLDCQPACEPAAEPAGAEPLPLPAPALLPPPPPAEETKLLHVAPGFPADEVLWALHCQALCRGHPHLLQLREVEVQPQQLALVVDRGVSTVQDLIDTTACMGAPASEAAVQRLFQQLVVGLAFCHRQGLASASVHPRDLTLHASDSAPAAGGAPPAAEGADPQLGGDCSLALKLHDFSAALAAATGGAYSSGGGVGIVQWLCTEQDPSYSAPEVIAARLSDDGQAPPVSHAAADVWSAGAILFAMLSGGPPFSRPSDAALPPQPKAVATLLRINTGGSNAVHGQVSDECQDVLRLALEPDVSRRASMPALLAHPWVARDMPPALRRINAQLLAPPGSHETRRQEAAAAAAAAAGGRKRQHIGALPRQAAKRAAIQTLETLLAMRVDGPLRCQYGTPASAAFATAATPQLLAPVVEAAVAYQAVPALAAEADSHHVQQTADEAEEAHVLAFPAAVERQTSPAAPPQLAITAPDLQPAATAAPAAATEPSTPHHTESPAADSESSEAEPESDQPYEPQLLSSDPAAQVGIEPTSPQANAGRDLFDSPSSLEQLLATPVAGSLRLRFGSSKLPSLNGRVHSPLGWQSGGKADVHANTPNIGSESSSKAASPRKPENSCCAQATLGCDMPSGGGKGELAAAAGAEDCTGGAQLLDGDSPRFLAAAALAETLAASYDAGTGFQRFSNDSAYRQEVRSAKLAAAHITAAAPELTSCVARALDFGSCSTSGGASPAATSPAASVHSPSPVASCSTAPSVASTCLTPFVNSPRSPVAAAHPAAAAVPACRPGIPPLRLDRLPALLAPLAEAAQGSGAAEPPPHPRDAVAAAAEAQAAEAVAAAQPPAESVSPPLPALKVSGAELCSTAALVRLVAAAAFATRSMAGGSSGNNGLPTAAAGASWGGVSLQERQKRALEHSDRLHACYMSLLAAGNAAT